ncbi:MarR family transcriptional regulator [Streptomyces sp. WAC05374]|uniref:MarR family winged helix-turn-helix transcriptional regulator n=1 Tax=Streptomyces sp. WAC05374 TaxID=2487420 RepID=UPI000F87CCBC|nr:MarR family winged helix-turn-helix transcriptional regulator [Streptomyces sp. WAC05374]RST12696.1 MarR family transcriptional regulator [Streptomyces sp. WAC05374]TDF47229.1 MarR family transcriptional regulator [Streptomyces sp. WAC05374]TDF57487.1 MarR family transcriptional regulator [Streptomyces sp. WAC05374]TDF61592.1 MarR family transcriptional regulator [Streptomyces sp. WAC05374]
MTTTTTSPAPADPAAADEDLASQPIGYWSGVVHRAVITHIRDAMARVDVTQPQWWTLNRVDAGGDVTREVIAAGLADVADTPHDASRAVDHLLHRGWLRQDDDRHLHLTEEGRAAKARIKELVTRIRAEIHDGIGDDEYVAALKVLRRMAANVAALKEVS